MSAKCHVWTAPELAREIFTSRAGRCSHVFGLLVRFHMAAGHNALRGSGPGQKPAFDNALAQWVVLIAGSTGSALRAVRPPNLHITPDGRRDLVTPPARPVPCSARSWPSSPMPFLRSYWRARSRRPSSAAAPTTP